MIVAALTTMRSRVPYLRETLDSLVGQRMVDRVLLLAEPELCGLIEVVIRGCFVELHEVEDIGPGKKHLATRLCSPSDVIVTFDDDHVYEPDHASRLVYALRETDKVCGFFGCQLDGSDVREGPADFLSGAQSWAYRAGWLTADDVLEWGRHPRCWHSDDVYLGAIFRRYGRRIHVVSAPQAYFAPRANPRAFLSPDSLRFHVDRLQRGAACQRTAWADLEGSAT